MLFSLTWSEVLLALHFTVVVACAVRVLYRQRNTGSAFAWLVILLAFPMVGVIAYLLVGETRIGRRRLARTSEMTQFYQNFASDYLTDEQHFSTDTQLPKSHQGIEKMVKKATGLGANQHNDMQLLTSTDDIINAMIDDIRQAKLSCLLAFYIIEPEGRIDALLQAVLDAAQRGVRCVILADAIGSSRFFRSPWHTKLQLAGVFVQSSLPISLLRTLYTRNDLRNHRKILVVDYYIGYTGSFNLIDPRYFKKDSGVGEWVDVMMRCTGAVVLEMAAVLYADIAVESEGNLQLVQSYLLRYEQTDVAAIPTPTGNITTQVIPSAPEQDESIIYETILCAIHSATKRIVITTPYFVPNEPLLIALTTAARRGVDVTLILPEKVDSIMVRYASRAYFPLLLKHGIKIAQFNAGLLHAKTLVIDDDFSLFGTVNMDMRSFFLNLEISLAIYNRNMTAQIAALQQQYLADSRYIDEVDWLYRQKWWGLVENIVRLVSPLL